MSTPHQAVWNIELAPTSKRKEDFAGSFRLGLTILGRSRRGRGRTGHEGTVLAADLAHRAPPGDLGEPVTFEGKDRPVLLAVSRGAQGADAARLTRAMALQALRRCVALHQPRAAQEADRRGWFGAGAAGGRRRGVSLAAMLFHGPHAFLAEIGNARAYLLRGGQLLQLTRGQSYTRLAPEAEGQPGPQAAGADPGALLALTQVSLRRGDRFLLCSGGLVRALKHEDIELLLAAPTLAAACAGLLHAASEHSGRGSLSALLAEVNGEDLPPSVAGECISLVTALDFFPAAAD